MCFWMTKSLLNLEQQRRIDWKQIDVTRVRLELERKGTRDFPNSESLREAVRRREEEYRELLRVYREKYSVLGGVNAAVNTGFAGTVFFSISGRNLLLQFFVRRSLAKGPAGFLF